MYIRNGVEPFAVKDARQDRRAQTDAHIRIIRKRFFNKPVDNGVITAQWTSTYFRGMESIQPRVTHVACAHTKSLRFCHSRVAWAAS